MHSAPLARKNLLSALTEQVLRPLQDGGPLDILLAQATLKTTGVFKVRELHYPLLLQSDSVFEYPNGRRWPEANMLDQQCPYLSCLVEGEADLKVGVTDMMLAGVGPDRRNQYCGAYSVTMRAPSYLLIPAGVPCSTGVEPPWHRPTPHKGLTRILRFRFLPVGTLCHISTLQDGKYDVSYSLMVRDMQTHGAIELLMDELRGQFADLQIIRAQLTVVMLRLQRSLLSEVPPMTAGLLSLFPEGETELFSGPLSAHPVLPKVHDFIKLHLHEHLTASEVARHVCLSSTQLNRILKAHLGTSVMGYLTQHRVETAKLVLQSSDLPVQEVGRLVGFKQLSHFSRTFHAHTGKSPLKFRQIFTQPLPPPAIVPTEEERGIRKL